jgi:hypothetical protein
VPVQNNPGRYADITLITGSYSISIVYYIRCKANVLLQQRHSTGRLQLLQYAYI